jgi:hypothetical protein
LRTLTLYLSPRYKRSTIAATLQRWLQLSESHGPHWDARIRAAAALVGARVDAAAPSRPHYQLADRSEPKSKLLLIEDVGEGLRCRRTFLTLHLDETSDALSVAADHETCCTPLECQDPSPLSTVARFMDAVRRKQWKVVRFFAPPSAAIELTWNGACPVTTPNQGKSSDPAATCPESARHARITPNALSPQARDLLPPVTELDIPEFECPDTFQPHTAVTCCATLATAYVCFGMEAPAGKPVLTNITTESWTR